MNLYTKIAGLFFALAVVSIIAMGLLADRVISDFYKRADISDFSRSLRSISEYISGEYSNRTKSGLNTEDIRSVSGNINKSLLRLEELDLFKNELKISLMLAGIILPLMIIGFAAVFFIILVRSLFKPIKVLTDSMEKYSNGNSSGFPVPVNGTPETKLMIQTTNDMIDRISQQQQTIRAQGAFIAWRLSAREMVHAIKNVLTPARLSAESVYERALDNHDESLKNDMAHILASINSLQRLSFSLKECSNLKVPEPEMVDLYVVASEAAGLFNKNGGNITVEGATLPVFIDRTLIRLAVDNILSNACDATEGISNRKIIIRLLKEGGPIFECQDNGPGIAPENRERALSLNYTTKSEGTGFGLYFCRKVMQDMGYYIEIDSAPEGSGAVIRLVFSGNNINN